ncbi:50S ribosomal protein L21e [Candidatus Pacearchaeota archaeon]|nr:50S ribosomal protein L21e [Candidatus Pacearchaeota archaeon]
MLKHKSPRTKGKISLTKYFQKFKEGDKVAVVRELSVKFGYSNRIHGRTGRVLAKRGSAYEVEINDINKPKKYVLKPIHLKRIEGAKAQ